MKKLKAFCLLVICFLLAGGILPQATVFANTIPSSVTVTLQTPVYTQPSLTSSMFTKQDNSVIYLAQGTTLTVDTTFKHDMFYKVIVYKVIETAKDGDFGYVLKSQTLNSSIQSPAKKLEANATVKNNNSQIFEYNQNTNTYTLVENLTLNQDTPVRVLDGYDANKEYTYISFTNLNGEIVFYYIQTINLAVNGINYSVLIAIIILISCAGIIAAMLGIKSKKSKKQKRKR